MAGLGKVARKMLLGIGAAINDAGVVTISELVGSGHYRWVSLKTCYGIIQLPPDMVCWENAGEGRNGLRGDSLLIDGIELRSAWMDS